MAKKRASATGTKPRGKRKSKKGAVDLRRLEPVVKRYREERGAIIPMLQQAQAVYGYLPKSVMERIAEAGGVSSSEVYGVVTFYTQFRLKPVGEYVIRVCHGTACHVNGAERITETIASQLGIEEGGTTDDNKFTLESVVCLGCCSLAPVMMINEETYGRLTPKRVRTILKSY
jgi:NADH-quinone oxidoreductase subunit E